MRGRPAGAGRRVPAGLCLAVGFAAGLAACGGAEPRAATPPPSTPVGTSAPAAAPDCSREAVRDAPALTEQLARRLVGASVRACTITEGTPPQRDFVIPASRTSMPGWAEVISRSSSPLPSGYTESRSTQVYLQVDGRWHRGRAVGQAQDA